MIAAGYTRFGLASPPLPRWRSSLYPRRDARSEHGVGQRDVLGRDLLGAGVYQFSALKHACLTQCQHPFPFFFANWPTTPRGVFRLGIKQGLYCLGCCWAMMLVMFSVGVMNVMWMAALGMVMTIEKIGTGKRFTSAVGVGLIGIGIPFVLAAVAAHWPGQGFKLEKQKTGSEA